jgi:hypothetical protein
MSGMMLAHLLKRATGMPLWCCYGTVAATAGVAGAALLKSGGAGLANVELVPPQTRQAVKENLSWIKDRLTPAGG